MAQQQTVLSFFDNAAEAQQAVQVLLAEGFTPKNITLSTPNNPTIVVGSGPAPPIKTDSSSGRFFSSLFDSDDDQPDSPNFAIRRGTLITVLAQSPAEVKHISHLMDKSGAGDVSVHEPAT